MNRFLPSLIAALTLVGAGAGTASANTPLKIVADAGSNIYAHDHEFLADETFRRSFAGTTLGTLPAGNGKFSYKTTACAGDEVRTELFIDGYRFSDSNTATVTAHIDLYEGSSCATNDFDGQSKFVTITLKAGESKTVSLIAWSKEVGIDRGAADFTLRAIAG